MQASKQAGKQASKLVAAVSSRPTVLVAQGRFSRAESPRRVVGNAHDARILARRRWPLRPGRRQAHAQAIDGKLFHRGWPGFLSLAGPPTALDLETGSAEASLCLPACHSPACCTYPNTAALAARTLVRDRKLLVSLEASGLVAVASGLVSGSCDLLPVECKQRSERPELCFRCRQRGILKLEGTHGPIMS